MAITAYIPILCPQKQIAICSLTENIYFILWQQKKDIIILIAETICQQLKKTFPQHVLNQKLKCLQIYIIFKKQATVSEAVIVQGTSCQPTHAACIQQPHSTYLENLSTRADDLFLLTRESSFAVIFKDCEFHCLLLNGEGSILSPQIPAQEESTVSAIWIMWAEK